MTTKTIEITTLSGTTMTVELRPLICKVIAKTTIRNRAARSTETPCCDATSSDLKRARKAYSDTVYVWRFGDNLLAMSDDQGRAAADAVASMQAIIDKTPEAIEAKQATKQATMQTDLRSERKSIRSKIAAAHDNASYERTRAHEQDDASGWTTAAEHDARAVELGKSLAAFDAAHPEIIEAIRTETTKRALHFAAYH